MSKRYDFSNFRMDTDAEKATPVLEHDYRPVEDDQDIVVRCEHFKAGEKMKYASVNTEGNLFFDYRRIFLDKVESIEGLAITVTDSRTGKSKELRVTDPRTLASFPDAGVVSAIVTGVALHLINGDSLTETESKNSD